MNVFKISAVCITRNEEVNIKQSIESYKDIADEIIILDTGSTDNTVQICKDLGCTVYEVKWEDDFSLARNQAIERVRYPYILFLDADEYFEPKLTIKDKEYLKKVMLDSDIEGIKFLTHNVDNEINKNLYDSYNLKFFINHPKLMYKRKIHEVLRIDNKTLKIGMCNDLQLVHTGYTKNVNVKKIERNIEILNSLEDKETIDYFYLARENLGLSNYKECGKYCDLFFEQPDCDEVVKNSDIAYMIYFYKYYYLKKINDNYIKNRKDLEELLNIMVEKIPFIPQVYHEFGFYENDRNYKKAYEYYTKAIETNNNFSSLSGYVNMYSSFEPDLYFRLSCLDAILGNKEKAISRATVACMLDRDNILYLKNLLRIIKDKSPNKIIDEIYKIYRPSITSDYELIVKALSNTKLNSVFLHFLSEYNIKYNGGNKLVYIGMMLSNQSELAIDTALSIYEKSGNEVNQFMATLAIIYSNNRSYYKKYFNRFKESYQHILKFHFDNDIELSQEEFSEYMNLYVRMYFVGRESSLKFSIDYFSNNDFINLFSAYEGIGDYKSMIKLSNSILELKSKNEELNATAVNRLIISLFATKKYSEMLSKCLEYRMYLSDDSIRKFVGYLTNLSGEDKLIQDKLLNEVY